MAPATATIPEDVLGALSEAIVAEVGGGWRLTLPPLERKLYTKTDKVLKELGGKWNRSAQAHVFPQDPREKIDAARDSGQVVSKAANGFFETPPELAQKLVELAEVESHHYVLEPSAGRGALCRVIRQAAPGALIDVCELLPENRELLESKLYNVVADDFMEAEPRDVYDRVIMNPPFAKHADAKHVLHAYKFLAPGGRLAAIMSAAVSFNQIKAYAEVRRLIYLHGSLEHNPEGSFKASGTNVNTVTVVIDKEA